MQSGKTSNMEGGKALSAPKNAIMLVEASEEHDLQLKTSTIEISLKDLHCTTVFHNSVADKICSEPDDVLLTVCLIVCFL